MSKAVITIHQNTDFRRVYGRGKSCKSPALVIYSLKNRAGICRIGITTSKKLGGAVERNRCRRVTGTCAAHHRELTTAIKRARQVALLPYVND